MDSRFLVLGGGTGAALLETLVHFSAMGALRCRSIHVLLADVDPGDEALQRAKAALDRYRHLRTSLGGSLPAGFFAPEIYLYHWPAERQLNKLPSLRDGLAAHGSSVLLSLRSLFDEAELELAPGSRYSGNAALISSAFLRLLAQTPQPAQPGDELAQFIAAYEATDADRVLMACSPLGSTGLAACVMLEAGLRKRSPRMRTAAIALLLVEPWLLTPGPGGATLPRPLSGLLMGQRNGAGFEAVWRLESPGFHPGAVQPGKGGTRSQPPNAMCWLAMAAIDRFMMLEHDQAANYRTQEHTQHRRQSAPCWAHFTEMSAGRLDERCDTFLQVAVLYLTHLRGEACACVPVTDSNAPFCLLGATCTGDACGMLKAGLDVFDQYLATLIHWLYETACHTPLPNSPETGNRTEPPDMQNLRRRSLQTQRLFDPALLWQLERLQRELLSLDAEPTTGSAARSASPGAGRAANQQVRARRLLGARISCFLPPYARNPYGNIHTMLAYLCHNGFAASGDGTQLYRKFIARMFSAVRFVQGLDQGRAARYTDGQPAAEPAARSAAAANAAESLPAGFYRAIPSPYAFSHAISLSLQGELSGPVARALEMQWRGALALALLHPMLRYGPEALYWLRLPHASGLLGDIPAAGRRPGPLWALCCKHNGVDEPLLFTHEALGVLPPPGGVAGEIPAIPWLTPCDETYQAGGGDAGTREPLRPDAPAAAVYRFADPVPFLSPGQCALLRVRLASFLLHYQSPVPEAVRRFEQALDAAVSNPLRCAEREEALLYWLLLRNTEDQGLHVVPLAVKPDLDQDAPPLCALAYEPQTHIAGLLLRHGQVVGWLHTLYLLCAAGAETSAALHGPLQVPFRQPAENWLAPLGSGGAPTPPPLGPTEEALRRKLLAQQLYRLHARYPASPCVTALRARFGEPDAVAADITLPWRPAQADQNELDLLGTEFADLALAVLAYHDPASLFSDTMLCSVSDGSAPAYGMVDCGTSSAGKLSALPPAGAFGGEALLRHPHVTLACRPESTRHGTAITAQFTATLGNVHYAVARTYQGISLQFAEPEDLPVAALWLGSHEAMVYHGTGEPVHHALLCWRRANAGVAHGIVLYGPKGQSIQEQRRIQADAGGVPLVQCPHYLLPDRCAVAVFALNGSCCGATPLQADSEALAFLGGHAENYDRQNEAPNWPPTDGRLLRDSHTPDAIKLWRRLLWVLGDADYDWRSGATPARYRQERIASITAACVEPAPEDAPFPDIATPSSAQAEEPVPRLTPDAPAAGMAGDAAGADGLEAEGALRQAKPRGAGATASAQARARKATREPGAAPKESRGKPPAKTKPTAIAAKPAVKTKAATATQTAVKAKPAATTKPSKTKQPPRRKSQSAAEAPPQSEKTGDSR